MSVLPDHGPPAEAVPPSQLALVRAIAAYLPETMVAALVQSADLTDLETMSEPRCFDAATMMVDITGFTPLCEALARRGREGAEQVAALINGFFTEALRPVQEQGGVIAKFGGDSFMAFFARDDGESWERVLRRALAGAFALQSLVVDYQGLRLGGPVEPGAPGAADLVFRLSAKVGLSAGTILTFSVGIPSRHRDFQAAGPPFNEAAEAEHHASKGEIVVHEALLRLAGGLREHLDLGAARQSTRPILGLAGLRPDRRRPPVDLAALPAAALNAVLSRAIAFVPRPVYERLRLDSAATLGEHRRVISMFVNVAGFAWIDDPAAPAQFHAYYLALLAEVERHSGHLNRVSSGDKGDLLHVIFGAPLAHEDDEEQALRCALALQEVARRQPGVSGQTIGLSGGFVFAGEIGSASRREYTVMGDSVNLSARLMQLAGDWSIVLDAAFAKRMRESFEFTLPRAVRLKGKQGMIDICELLGVRDDSALPRSPLTLLPLLPIYGRDHELGLAMAALESARAGSPAALLVSGEPGIGKSVFLAHVAHRWHGAGGRVCHVSVQHYERGAFTLWAKWLGELLRLDAKAVPERRADQLQRTIAALDPDLEEWAPLWGELLNLQLAESPLLRALDRPTRHQRLAELTPRLLCGLARRQPLLLLGDDIHWSDSASFELLDAVVPQLRDAPILIGLGYRESEVTTFGLLTSERCQSIPLQALSPAASQDLIRYMLDEGGGEPADQERLGALVGQQAGGNPFFITELLAALAGSQSGDLAAAGDSLKDGALLSYNLQSLIMARLDGLDSRLREVVLAASVVGGEFSDETIRPLVPASVAETLDYAAFSPLHQLHDLDLLVPDVGLPARPAEILGADPRRARPSYRFRHALFQQVAYESLPFARRRTLHEQVGQFFESQRHGSADSLLERLSYHYERSANDPKAVWYLARSAERSARLFANQEALRQYEAAVARISQATVAIKPRMAELLRGLGDVQAQVANFDAALSSYDRALAHTAATESLERARLEQRRAEVLVRATRFEEAQAAMALVDAQLAVREAALPARGSPAPRDLNQIRLAQAQVAELRSTIHMRQAAFEQAFEWAERGLDLLEGAAGRQSEGASARIKLYQALAAAAPMLGRMDAAQQAIAQALRLSQRRADPVLEGQLQLRLAIFAMRSDELARASRFFNRALPMIERTGARDRLAYVLLPGGETLLYRGQYAEAAAWIQRGLGLAVEVGAPFLVCAAHSLHAWVATVRGAWTMALDHFSQGVALAQQHGMWDRYAEVLSRQGEVLFYCGDVAQAETVVLLALRCAEEHDMPATVKIIRRVLAKILYKQGRFAQAAPLLRTLVDSTDEDTALIVGEWWALSTLHGESLDSPLLAEEIRQRAAAALDFFQSRGFKLFVPTARRINGLIAWAAGRPEEALRHFDHGLALARATGHLPEHARLLVERSRCRLAAGARIGAVRRDLNAAAALFARLGARPELGDIERTLG